MMNRLVSTSAGVWHLLRENGPVPVIRFAVYRFAKINASLPLNVGGVRLVLRTLNTDLNVARHCLVEEEFSIVRKITSGSNVSFIIDAGGYIGTAAIAFARMFPKAIVVTVEPSKENFDILMQNVGQYSNIIPLKAALVGTDRDVNLYNRGTGHWGLTILPHQRNKKLAALHSVCGISIPTIMNRYGKNHIDILKLDIEGGEKEVLDQSSEWIPKIRVVFAELHDRVAPGCTEAFERATTGMTTVEFEGEKRLASR